MDNKELYAIISFLITVIAFFITLYFKSNAKKEDKIVVSLDKLTTSLIDYKNTNIQEHARIETVIVEKTNKLDKRVLKLESAQNSTLCPVISKQQQLS